MPNPLIEQKMKEMLELSQNSLSKQEFLDAFKTVIELIKKLQSSNKESSDKLESGYSTMLESVKGSLKDTPLYRELIDMIKSDSVFELDDHKNKNEMMMSDEMKKMHEKHEEMMGAMEEKMVTMKKEVMPDVKMITKDASFNAHKSLLPIMFSSIKTNITGKLIVKALSDLPEEDKLDIDAIKNLRKELDNLRRSSQSFRGIGGGGVGKHNVVYYDLSPSLNGSTRTFSLPAFFKIIDIKLNSVPVMRLDIDYSVDSSNSKITFTSEITNNDILAGMSCIILYSE